MTDSAKLEAQIFARYLIKRQPTSGVIKLYERGVSQNKPGASDEKLLAFLRRHPRLTGLVDAGLVFYRPHSEVRRRIYVMLAILESSPEYHDSFLPAKRSPFYLFFVAYSGLRAIIKSLCGLVLVKAVS
jgi:hypothetical protein